MDNLSTLSFNKTRCIQKVMPLIKDSTIRFSIFPTLVYVVECFDLIDDVKNACDSVDWSETYRSSHSDSYSSKIPIFGICLGHQLLALAGGADTYKMKFGHHGANHPVQDIKTKEVYITSQNHGFAVDVDTLPSNIKVTHISLFDKSLQGIEFTDTPAFSFQGHPEASPGPQEIQNLFKKFSLMVKEYAKT